jgi:hypothetical protein
MVAPNALTLNLLTAGATVKFKLGYSWQTGTKVYDSIFRVRTPRFPKEISKSDVRARKINSGFAWEKQDGAVNKTIAKYNFNTKTRELLIAIDKSVSLAGIKKGDSVRITATGGSQLANINQEVIRISDIVVSRNTNNLNYHKIKIMIPASFSIASTSGLYAVPTGTNILLEVSKTKPKNSYLCYIVDKGVTNNLIFTEYFRIVPIFAYSIMGPTKAWSDKTIMTTNTTVTDASAPAWTSLPGTYNCSIPIRQTEVITSDSDSPKIKFYVAIAKYYRDEDTDPWTGEWFQKDGGKPIWKLATYTGDV